MNVHKRLRSLHRHGKLTHTFWAIGETLLWSCRAPGRVEFQVSYSRIAELAHCSRSTVALAVKRLRELGVLGWRRTWLWVAGRHVQWRNIYRFSESDDRATDQVQRERKAHRTRKWGIQPPIRTVEEQLRLLGWG